MLDPIKYIRKKIITLLTGAITHDSSTVLIYNRVPSGAAYPYIRVYGLSTNAIDDNKSKYNVECITRVEVITRFSGSSGGDLDANTIMSAITNLLVSKNQSGFDLSSDNFNCYAVQNEGVTYLEDDLVDHTYFRAILELSNKVEQTS
tara:strand:- start:697 stop:1137 length:441 start_codon:yes stop_codon:yes gene_type:complete